MLPLPSNTALSFGVGWDIVSANVYYISLYKCQNLTQDCFENAFHQKILLEILTHLHKYSTHSSTTHCILNSIEVSWSGHIRINKYEGKCKQIKKYNAWMLCISMHENLVTSSLNQKILENTNLYAETHVYEWINK
jgi:hypothetical protein